MSQPARPELEGTLVGGRYHLGRALGVGGTAVVFEATRLEDGSRFALKALREHYAQQPELIRRLRREAEVARAVIHPGIVPVVDEGILEDGSPFVVLERLGGECVARLLHRVGPLGVSHAAAIAVRAAAVLHAAHGYGYVHRDVKPEHVVLDRTPDGQLDVRLLDFGVCASSRAGEDERASERGRVYGTPSYVSPEQASGKPDVDARADVYGLGVLMFETLTGRVPFIADTVTNLLRRIIREDAPRLSTLVPDVDLRMDDVVGRAMNRSPDERFPSARALARALLPLVGDRRAVEQELARLVRPRPGDALPVVGRRGAIIHGGSLHRRSVA
jgi:serine/threonine-protein kinase